MSICKGSSVTSLARGAMVSDSYTMFRDWDATLSRDENFALMERRNSIGKSSQKQLKDSIRILKNRFRPSDLDMPLAVMAKSRIEYNIFRQCLMWHVSHREPLFRRFLSEWLFPRFLGGDCRVILGELEVYVGSARPEWSDGSVRRASLGLLRFARDFRLLHQGRSGRFQMYNLNCDAFLYVLYSMRDAGVDGYRMITSSDWGIFMMSENEVEWRVLRLHQYRRLSYEAAGSLIRVSLPEKTLLEYVSTMEAA